jgi:uncharacterized RDD family membrane protein YckC
MTQPPVPSTAQSSGPLYARFSRRLRAFLIDVAFFALIFYLGAIAVDSLAVADAARRLFLLGLAVAILAYDPFLVTFFGGTIGHRLTNLRVIDDRTGGNLGLFKAIARAAVKDLLGWLSFAAMAVTRRHQALHDVITHSTVQIRDLSSARTHNYVAERVIEPPAGLPSRVRRVLMIIAYIVLAYVAVSVVSVAILSRGCLAGGHCSGTETLISLFIGIAWVVASVVLIIRGWKGRLWGCRPRPVVP